MGGRNRRFDVVLAATSQDRICRRADVSADIYRRFVDLGSGRGMAVWTPRNLQSKHFYVILFEISCSFFLNVMMLILCQNWRRVGFVLAILASFPRSLQPTPYSLFDNV